MKKQPEPLAQSVQAAMQTLMPAPTTAESAKKLRTGLRDALTKIETIFKPFRTCSDPELLRARQAAGEFCMSMASRYAPAYWLTLCGKSGTGKTMLAKLCAKFFRTHLDGFRDERFDPATTVRYRRGGLKNWGTVMGDMLGGDYSAIRDLRSDWFLCLDDIGAEYSRNRDLASAKLYEVLNDREGLFTIITANLSVQDIGEQIDTRIASRLIRNGGVVVEVDKDTPDYNLR